MRSGGWGGWKRKGESKSKGKVLYQYWGAESSKNLYFMFYKKKLVSQFFMKLKQIYKFDFCISSPCCKWRYFWTSTATGLVRWLCFSIIYCCFAFKIYAIHNLILSTLGVSSFWCSCYVQHTISFQKSSFLLFYFIISLCKNLKKKNIKRKTVFEMEEKPTHYRQKPFTSNLCYFYQHLNSFIWNTIKECLQSNRIECGKFLSKVFWIDWNIFWDHYVLLK